MRYLHSLSRLLTYPIYRPTSSRFNNLPFKKITPLISKPFARFKRPLSAFNNDVFPHPISIFISSSLNTCWTKDGIDSIGRIKEALLGIDNDLVLVLDHHITPHNFLPHRELFSFSIPYCSLCRRYSQGNDWKERRERSSRRVETLEDSRGTQHWLPSCSPPSCIWLCIEQ